VRILSVRNHFQTDHSSTETRHIAGFSVTCDYDWWTCEFKIPAKKGLFEKIEGYNAESDYELIIEDIGKHIRISIHVHLDYGALAPNDPFAALADACYRVKENILKGDLSDLAVLEAYAWGDDKDYYALKSTSGIEKILNRVC